MREVQVLHDYAVQGTISGNSIVAAICPADLTSAPTDPGYGYNPAVAALVSRLKEKLKGSCLPRPLTVQPDGTVPCNVVEVVSGQTATSQASDCATFCQKNQRGTADSQMQTAVLGFMSQSGLCDHAGQPACSSMCLCLLNQESGSADGRPT